MRTKIVSILVGAWFMLSGSQLFAEVKCPELIITDLKITSINTYINFHFTIKNIGTDSILLSNIVLQTYMAYDSSLTSVVLKPSGGSILSYIRDGYLNPDSSVSSVFSVYPAVSIDSLSYLVADFYVYNVTECTADKNVVIAKIKVATKSLLAENTKQKIIWNASTQTLNFNTGIIGTYRIYGVNGIKLQNGELAGKQSIQLNLEKGLYFVEIVSDNRRWVKKFRVE